MLPKITHFFFKKMAEKARKDLIAALESAGRKMRLCKGAPNKEILFEKIEEINVWLLENQSSSEEVYLSKKQELDKALEVALHTALDVVSEEKKP